MMEMALNWEATYVNNTDEEIHFGLLSTDEMMILFGLYYEGEELATDDTDDPIPAEFCDHENLSQPPSTQAPRSRFNIGVETPACRVSTANIRYHRSCCGNVVE